MPPTPAEIPGYYFDTTRGRYFKVTNGAIPTTNSTTPTETTNLTKYHNNSIQAEKRNQDFEQEELEELRLENKVKNKNKKQHSQDIYKNPKVPKPNKKKFDFNDRNQKFTFDNLSLLNLKTGQINSIGSYLNDNVMNRAKFISPKRCVDENKIILPQCHIYGYEDSEFVILRLGPLAYDFDELESFNVINGNIGAEVFDTKRERIYTQKQHWYCKTVTGINEMTTRADFYPIFGSGISNNDSDFRIICSFNPQVLQLLSVLRTSNFDSVSIIRFNVFNRHTNDFTDLTFPLIKFLKFNFKKLHKRGKSLEHALGLHYVEFTNYQKKSIDEINKLLTSKNVNHRKRTNELNDFLSYHDGIRPEFIYSKPKGKKVDIENSLEIGKIFDNKFFLVFSAGEIISWDFDYKTKKFTNFRLYTTSLKIPVGSSIEVLGSTLYINTNSQVITLDYENSKIQTYKFGFIRKMFILNSKKWIIVDKKSIQIFYPATKKSIKILSYNNGNDVNQQFEIINDKKRDKIYLIFNVAGKTTDENGKNYKFLDLNSFDDAGNYNGHNKSEIIDLKIDFQFLKYGYFKDFILSKIIDLGEKDGRLHIGFHHEDKKAKNTIFESFLI
ncbi:hypothetical protein KGF54_002120 [Candida jiufengensis]|uniref:uncharacterized protein n=1 Tax=Candida jiufengensis TaxID=497108 RepID=UPI00222410D5|nr:uncharacterized protein KGF54_002120 [Candida jiufengensis]KAI5954345.1 hypothetical protein KGF54_002120 [Candida jiufengensis]